MSLSVQFFSLLAMIGTGVMAAAIIDIISTGIDYGEKYAFVRKYAVVLEVIGWILAGCWAFLVLYVVRDGAWRVYDPFAQLSGLLLYVSFIHHPFRFVGRLLLLLVVKPIWFVLTIVVVTIKYVVHFIFRLLKFAAHPFVLIFRKLFSGYFKSKRK